MREFICRFGTAKRLGQSWGDVGCVLTHRQKQFQLFKTSKFYLDGASGRTLRETRYVQ